MCVSWFCSHNEASVHGHEILKKRDTVGRGRERERERETEVNLHVGRDLGSTLVMV